MRTRTVLIVGAGPRLGAAIARRFGREHYRVALVSRSERSAEQVGRALRAEGIDADWAGADAADEDALTGAISRLGGAGGVDIAVHNLSVWRDASTLDLTARDLFADLEIGTTSLLTIARAVVPGMLARGGGGTILATGSAAADSPSPGAPSLGVQKAGLRVLVQAMAGELAPRGVHCATVTINGLIGDGTFAPERIAQVYAQLAAETAGPPETWRTIVPYPG